MVRKINRNDAEGTGSGCEPGGHADDADARMEADIEQVLMSMAKRGELEFGWIEERQEFGFWHPEPRVSHRREPRRSPGNRFLIGLAVVMAIPLTAGALDEAGEHRTPVGSSTPIEQANFTESPTPEPAAPHKVTRVRSDVLFPASPRTTAPDGPSPEEAPSPTAKKRHGRHRKQHHAPSPTPSKPEPTRIQEVTRAPAPVAAPSSSLGYRSRWFGRLATLETPTEPASLLPVVESSRGIA